MLLNQCDFYIGKITSYFFASLWTEPSGRSIFQKEGKTNIFPTWTEEVSSIRFLLYRLSHCCFQVSVELVYVLSL